MGQADPYESDEGLTDPEDLCDNMDSAIGDSWNLESSPPVFRNGELGLEVFTCVYNATVLCPSIYNWLSFHATMLRRWRVVTHSHVAYGLQGDPESFAVLRDFFVQQVPFIPDQIDTSKGSPRSALRVGSYYYDIPDYIQAILTD
jgi:hypothetical protein